MTNKQSSEHLFRPKDSFKTCYKPPLFHDRMFWGFIPHVNITLHTLKLTSLNKQQQKKQQENVREPAI